MASQEPGVGRDHREFMWPEALVGIAVLTIAGLTLYGATQIPVSPMFARIGPRVFPFIAGGVLVLLGALLLFQATRGGWVPEEERGVRSDFVALGYVMAGLIANMLLIGWAGFTIASTVMFVLIARGFGSRSLLRDIGIGFVAAVAAYFGFAKLLGISIGAGLFEQMLLGS